MKRLLAVLLVVGLLAAPALAGPGEVAAVMRVLHFLQEVQSTLVKINGVIEDTRHKLQVVYPDRALRPILRFFEEVNSIQDEITKMSCSWRFTLRTRRLWDGLYGGVKLCRPQIQMLLGQAPPFLDADLEEYEDFETVRRMNSINERISKGRKNQDTWAWLLWESQQGRNPTEPGQYSPGYSQRLSAVAASAMATELRIAGDTAMDELILLQNRENRQRRARRLEMGAALAAYESVLALGAPSAPPRVPGEPSLLVGER